MKNTLLLFASFLIYSLTFATNNEGIKNNEAESSAITTSISGRVLDKITGEALTGVKVSLEGINKSVYTDFEGNFEIQGVGFGNHELRTSYISYKQKVETVRVDVNKSNNVDVKIESITE